jgi:hypothetical protein
MAFKNIKGNVRNSLLDYFVSGKAVQYHSNQFGSSVDTRLGLTATGGVISDYSTPTGAVYRAHVFTSSGTGTRWHAGGGGAGGLLVSPGFPGIPTSQNQGSSITIPGTLPAPFSVTIGAGGVGATASGSSNVNPPTGGSPSSFGPVSVNGGGYGATYDTSGNPGGSGGGGGGPSGPAPTGGSATNYPGPTQQGFPGGNGLGSSGSGTGGGGGGAGGVGGSRQSPSSHGGVGLQVLIAGPPSPTFTGVGALGPGGGTQWFAGGGGAGFYPGVSDAKGEGGGPGGPYAGGGPGGPSDSAGINGTFATGGGGGSPSHPGAGSGSNGGSGIVVVRYQIGQLTATAKATGGAISYYGGKTIHTFTSSGTFTNPASISNVEIVMVAGGGAGGLNIGGGGGAGAVLEGSSITLPANTYTVTVGAGGAGRTSSGPSTPATASNTTISFPGPFTWTANRGGYGATYPDIASQSGGSGGGGVSDQPTGGTSTSTPSSTPLGTLTSYGNAGATSSGNFQGAGGGGAGGAGGAPPTPAQGGTGGDGRQLPATFRNPVAAPSNTTNPASPQRGGGLGTPGPGGGFYIAGGGGGSSYPTSVPAGGPGGFGGGGAGATGSNNPPATNAVSGVQNTGAGGGGSGYSPTSPSTSGSGGSGIVLIAYPS